MIMQNEFNSVELTIRKHIINYIDSFHEQYPDSTMKLYKPSGIEDSDFNFSLLISTSVDADLLEALETDINDIFPNIFFDTTEGCDDDEMDNDEDNGQLLYMISPDFHITK